MEKRVQWMSVSSQGQIVKMKPKIGAPRAQQIPSKSLVFRVHR